MNKVLIIEDEVKTAEPVKKALEIHDIEADIAINGVEGIRMFHEGDYDLVLLDLNMPHKNGEQVAIEIRDRDPFVDIIVYTAYREFEDIKKLANIGIDGFFNKGPDAELSLLVGMILNKLTPLSEDDVTTLVQSTPDYFFKEL